MGIEYVLGIAEWLALAVLAVEIIIASIKISLEHDINEGFKRLLYISAGGTLMIALANFFAGQNLSSGLTAIGLPSNAAQYIADAAIAAFVIGALYAGYIVSKGDLEHGFELMALLGVMFVILSSASNIVSQVVPGSASLTNLIDQTPPTLNNGPSIDGISLNFLQDIAVFATALPTFQNSTPFAYLNQFATAIAIVGLIMLAVWKFLFDMETELMRYIVTMTRDVVVVAIISAGFLDIWNGFADIVNGMIYYMFNSSINGFLNDVALVFAGWIAGAIAMGYFVPFMASSTANLFALMIVAMDLAAARYFLIYATVGAAPIIAALWLWPPIRGFITKFVEFVLGAAVGGLAAALALYAISISPYSTLMEIFAPFVVGLIPWASSIAMSGIGAGMGSGFFKNSIPTGGVYSVGGVYGGGGGSQQMPNNVPLNRPTPQVPVPGQSPSPQQPPQTPLNPQAPPSPAQSPSPQTPLNPPQAFNPQPLQPNPNPQAPLVQPVAQVGSGYRSSPSGSGSAGSPGSGSSPINQTILNRQSPTTARNLFDRFVRTVAPPTVVRTVLARDQSEGWVPSDKVDELRNQVPEYGIQGIVTGKTHTVDVIGSSSDNEWSKVSIKETWHHALWDAVKNNTKAFMWHFDVAMHHRTGLSMYNAGLGTPSPNFEHPLRKYPNTEIPDWAKKYVKPA